MHEKRRELQQRSHQQLLKRFDEDGDGKLNQHEKANAKAHAEKRRNQMRRKLLNQFDADGDGKLNDAERENARNAMEMRIENERRNRQQQRNQRQENPATENPRPHDNQPERRRRPLQRFDTNQDGKLDDSERAAMRNAREAMRKKQPNPAELEHPQPQN